MRRGLWGLALGLTLLAAAWSLWPRSKADGPVQPVDAPLAHEPAASKPKRRLVFRRPVVTNSAEAAARGPDLQPVDPLPDVPTEVREVELDELPPELLQARLDEGHDALSEMVEACEEHAPDTAKVMALTTLDDQGLLEMVIEAYDDDGEASWVSDAEVPIALVQCLEQVIWDREWAPMPEGSQMRMGLSMRFEADAEE